MNPITCLVRLLLDLDDMPLQLLAVPNSCFRIEEVFCFKIQYKNTAVRWPGAKHLFDFPVPIHGDKLMESTTVTPGVGNGG